MKLLVLILLLGNLVLLATLQWGWPLAADEPAVRAQPALHEQKIKLLGTPPAKPDAAPAPGDAVPVLVDAPMPQQDKPAAACLEWGEFSGTDLAHATAALSALQLGGRLRERQVEYDKGYWVYIPPQKDRAAVNQKIAQLKARSINEYFVVQDAGPWHNAISLGVFRTQEAAQHFLDELRRNNDVRSAQVGERASKLRTTIFVLTGMDDETAAAISGIQKNFPGSELKNVDCPIPDGAMPQTVQ